MSKKLKDEHDEKFAAHVFGVFEKAAVKASKEKLIEVILIALKGMGVRREKLRALSEEELRQVFLTIMHKSIPKLVKEGLEGKIRSMVQAEPAGE
jgi:hypothetical protein